eukprot:COSAG02_NODE_48563_length_333_cov_0.470085_1_plen_40_part_01
MLTKVSLKMHFQYSQRSGAAEKYTAKTIRGGGIIPASFFS